MSTTRRPLFFDEADLPRIRANTTDPRFAEYWRQELAADMAADTKFLTTELRLTNHVIHLLRAQRILERTSSSISSTAIRPAGARETGHAADARLPGVGRFIEGGRQVLGMQRATEGTVALLQAIDCLGDLTAAEVAEVEQAVLTKGVPACHAAGVRDEISRPRAGLGMESAQRGGCPPAHQTSSAGRSS
jgi:hypothetical protein